MATTTAVSTYLAKARAGGTRLKRRVSKTLRSNAFKEGRNLILALALIFAQVLSSVGTIITYAPTVANAAQTRSWNEIVGFDAQKFINYMDSHKSTFFGTPYSMANRMSGPGAGMDCSSFIGFAVLRATGVNLGSVVSGNPSWMPSTNDIYEYLLGKNADVDYYSSFNQMLKSGTLQKGDLIFASTSPDFADGGPTHALFHWSDSSSENKAWHQGSFDIQPHYEGHLNQISGYIGKVNNPSHIAVFHITSNGKLALAKISSNAELTNGNDCYNLSGAWFHVYKDGSGWSTQEQLNAKSVGWLETGAEQNKWDHRVAVAHEYGKSNEYLELPAGTYWVREEGYTSNGQGIPKNYTINSTETTPDGKYYVGEWIKVEVKAGETTWVTYGDEEGYVQNEPMRDPNWALVQKLDGTTAKDAQGKGTLGGAEFTVKYYDNTEGNVSGTPERTWVFASDEDGYVQFDRSPMLVAGDALYVNHSGDPVMPVGTYAVQETKAPEGYLISDNSVHVAIVADFDGDGVAEWKNQDGWNNRNADVDFEGRAVEDQIITGGVEVQKIDHDRDESIPEGDATLAGAQISIYSENDNPVVVDGKAYNKGDVVLVITTDASGKAQSAINALPFGDYTAKETKAPTGYLLNETWRESFQIREDGKRTQLATLSDDVVRGGIELTKVDLELNATVAQGDGTLAGAVISIANAGKEAVVVNGNTYNPGEEVTTITTDEQGHAATPSALLPYSTYKLTEKETPRGYLLNSDWSKTVEVREQNVIVDAGLLKDQVIRGGAAGVKIDHELDEQVPQGDATLAGAELQIVNASAAPVMVNDTYYDVNSVVATVTTNERGEWSTAANALPYGTYYVIESKAPTGYLLNTEYKQGFSILEDGVVYQVEPLSDQVIRGDVVLGKVDAEILQHLPLGAGELGGVEFELTNRSDHKVMVDGSVFEPGEVVKTIVTDGDGIAKTEGGALPYGSYSWKETKAPYGYLTGDNSGSFQIREDGEVVDLSAVETSAVNQVVRGEMYFNKVQEDSMREMAGVPFRITSQTTGESHIIVTDENGQFASDIYDDGMRNNGNDAAITADGTVDESKLDPESGVWFSGRVDVDNPLHDNLSSFPVDTYTLEELPCSANEGRTMISRTFTIRAPERLNNRLYDLGTIDNHTTPTIGTTLTDENGSHTVKFADEITLVDTVAYEKLTVGEEYVVRGVLSVVVDGEVITDVASAQASFKATSTSGTTDVTFTFPTENLDLNGKKLVAFEYLYNAAGDLIAKHEDPNDPAQTVEVPQIKTTLTDESGSKEVSSVGTIKLVDTVSYSGLTVGKTYSLKGELFDKVTAESLGISANATFTPESTSGIAKVTFEVDASALAGKSVVAFEEVLENGRSIAVHADLSDEDQTLTFPKIGTTLTGDEGAKVVKATKVELKDTIAYENLVPNKEYVALGELHVTDGTQDLGAIEGARSEITFKASETGTGTVEVTFEVDASALAGKDVVAFEQVGTIGTEVDAKFVPVATHEDPSDKGQTVGVEKPQIGTTLTDEHNQKSTLATESTTLIDTIAYEGLTSSETFVAKGELHEIAADGSDLGVVAKAEETFVAADGGKGIVAVKFTFDATKLTSTNVCAFEQVGTLASDGTFAPVATHEDPNDPEQTVVVPKIGTTLTGKEGEKVMAYTDKMELVDTIAYKGLVPGKTYTAKGELYDKATGKSLEIFAEAEFTPEASSGETTVTFVVDKKIATGTSMVAFEKVLDGEREIAIHADLTDEAQTVVVPKIGTTLTNKADGSHKAGSGSTTLVDVVSYEGLEAGKTYTMQGELVDKSTGKSTGIKSEQKFTAQEGGKGEVQLTFSVNGSSYLGKSLVAFETALDANGKVVAEHKDINDGSQTVTFERPTVTTNTPKRVTNSPSGGTLTRTGDPAAVGMVTALALAGLAGVGIKVFVSKKDDSSKDDVAA